MSETLPIKINRTVVFTDYECTDSCRLGARVHDDYVSLALADGEAFTELPLKDESTPEVIEAWIETLKAAKAEITKGGSHE